MARKMYIKSIVLDGFKSYGHRTEITGFDEQFNAITGLNGSGKSNILDSICFVLGISNLSHVRVGSLQDLIYKNGQAGINKATVSVKFDNQNKAQCPPGYEAFQEITITRQIVIGGKNKYLINGTNVPNKKVQDLFCSIQLNVNNPHFLIMQGRITKVLNMKPLEILSMVEEAAGTRMYEVKRQMAQKTVDKKNAKLHELQSVFKEEVSVRLEKLREERSQYLEYQRIIREIEHMKGIYTAWCYFEATRVVKVATHNLEETELKVQNIQQNIAQNITNVENLQETIEKLIASNKSELTIALQEKETDLKQKEKISAKANASTDSIKNSLTSEKKKVSQMEKNIIDEQKTLDSKRNELANVDEIFTTLKQNDNRDTEAFELAQKKFEALSTGCEVNEAGEAETLQEQLMNVKREAAETETRSKKAGMELEFATKKLQEKKRELGGDNLDSHQDESKMKSLDSEVKSLTNQLNNLNFSEESFRTVQDRRLALRDETHELNERVGNFVNRKPFTRFEYRDPEAQFDRSRVFGVVCRRVRCKDAKNNVAIETAAGGNLYNVIVDTDATSKKLLQNGQLQQRTTFIPLNKIQAHPMDDRTIQFAQNLVGKENCQPALALLDYDKRLQKAMEYIFGNVFICKNMDVARQVTFHEKIRRRCVTLDGDVTDPSGTLSGGATKRGGSILSEIAAILEIEKELAAKEHELQRLDAEVEKYNRGYEKYEELRRKLGMKQHDLGLVRQKLEMSNDYVKKEEVRQLEQQIVEFKQSVQECKKLLSEYNAKAKSLDAKMEDSVGYRDKQLKAAEETMKQMKKKAETSRKEWKQREQDYESLKLEISELEKGIETTRVQIESANESIVVLEKQLEDTIASNAEVHDEVKRLEDEIKKAKQLITVKNKEVQRQVQKKEQILATNSTLEIELKKLSHDVKKAQDDLKHAKDRENSYSQRANDNHTYIEKAQKMTNKEASALERNIKISQEREIKLSRTVNAKAQSMFEIEEKVYNDIKKKESFIITDRDKLLLVIKDLDSKKKNSLQLAHEQVSKQFGSIFATLLPGTNAKLVAPYGKSILDGLEIKVSLGNIWKDNLSELSGGQRSLAALSLILAMLLFKPAPLYILDEVDAALDLSHTQNIGNMLKQHFKKSQFIIVSLKDGMFNNANVLFRTKFVDGVSAISRCVNNNNRAY